MDDKDFREPEYGEVLLNIDSFFAPFTLIATVDHLLRLYKLVQTVVYINGASELDCFFWNFN